MSRRYWNTALERQRLNDLVNLTVVLYLYELFDSPTTSVLNIPRRTTSNLMSLIDRRRDSVYRSLRMALFVAVVQNFVALSTPLESLHIIYTRSLLINDLNESDCVSFFRFRQADLTILVNQLWPRMSHFFVGNYHSVVALNGYRVPFETGVLLILYRLSFPHVIVNDMESFFKMRKSHISAVVAKFMDVFLDLSTLYFTNITIWHKYIPYYAQLIEKKVEYPQMFGVF